MELRLELSSGWTNYYALSQYYRPLPELDEWIPRRVRMCYIKQWRLTRARIRHLLAPGASTSQAIPVGISSKGTLLMFLPFDGL
jgi:hypothetical protein